MAKGFYQCAECGKRYPHSRRGQNQAAGHNRQTGHRGLMVVDEQGNLTDQAGLDQGDDPGGDTPPESPPAAKASTPTGSKTTVDAGTASAMLFQPRTMLVPFTPIMAAVRKLAIDKWGFPQEVKMEDLIDSVFSRAARDRGFLVADYIEVQEDDHATEIPRADGTSEGTRPDRAGEAVPVAG